MRHTARGRRRVPAFVTAPVAALIGTLVLAACGGSAATPTPVPPTSPPATQAATAGPTAAATDPATGPANIDAPASVPAGQQFDVTFTGPNGPGDYITIVAASATEWTNESYVDVANGSPQKFTAPAEPGAYVLWYVKGDDDSILFRRDIAVTAFVGSLDAPESVGAGTTFQVTWVGPNGPGDYVTIVKAGATAWTNESYFDTANGNPGTLQAPLEAGAYEVWYVLGPSKSIEVRIPITVLPVEATVSAPDSAGKGTPFDVAWTGPDGPGDFITIVAAGAPEAAYLDYCYTSDGSPCSLTAPDDAGPYEVRYVTRQNKVIASRPIAIR